MLWEREKATWPNHDLSQFVEAGGLRWHVQRTGFGPPLLLVHGTGASTHSWRDLLPILGEEYSVLSVDLPGHGFTDEAGSVQSSIGGMSDSVAGLLRTLQFKPWFCVGHSAGAAILCRMALNGHIAPRAIVSVNGAFLPLSGVAGRIFAPAARFLADSPFLSALIARRAGDSATVARVIAGTGSTLDASGIELYARLVKSPKHLAGALRMMANWDLYSFARELPRLQTRLALIAADNDLTVPVRQALQVKEVVSDATLHMLPGLGHLAHEEQPMLVAQTILRICRSTP